MSERPIPNGSDWLMFKSPAGALYIAHVWREATLLSQGFARLGPAIQEVDQGAYFEPGKPNGSPLDRAALREGAIILVDPRQGW